MRGEAKSEEDYSGRVTEGMLLIAWSCWMLWSIVSPFHVDCDGGPGFGSLAWTLPAILVGIPLVGMYLLGLGYAVVWLAGNQPERALGVLLLPKELWPRINIHYRRAPRMWTITGLVLAIACSNAYLRYDLRVHAAEHYTRVHDRLLDTWRTYTWQDCEPDDSPIGT
jgi:hypothetical protein